MKQMIINKGASNFMQVENESVKSLVLNIVSDEAVSSVEHSTIADVDIKIEQKSKTGELLSQVYNGDLSTLLKAMYNENPIDLGQMFARYNFELDFGTFFSLKDSVLHVEIDNNMFSTDATTSVIKCYTKEGVGKQVFYPKIEKLNLDATLSSHSLNLGNDIVGVTLNDKDFSKVSSLLIKSDKLDIKENGSTLSGQFNGTTNQYGSALVLNLFKGFVQNDLSLDVDFTAAASGREIYILRAIQTPELLNRYVHTNRKHQSENRHRLFSQKK